MAGTYKTVSVVVAGKSLVFADFASFTDGQFDGQLSVAKDTGDLYYWDATLLSWVIISSGGGPVAGYYPEPVITLTGTDIANKYIILSQAPTSKPLTRLTVVGGPSQEYGIDFEVTAADGGKRLRWESLGLEGVLAIGDKLIITYN